MNIIYILRVPIEDRIFEGVFDGEVTEGEGPYCKCNYILLKGVDCTCGHGELIETCDDDLGKTYGFFRFVLLH